MRNILTSFIPERVCFRTSRIIMYPKRYKLLNSSNKYTRKGINNDGYLTLNPE